MPSYGDLRPLHPPLALPSEEALRATRQSLEALSDYGSGTYDEIDDVRMWLTNGARHAARLRALVHPRTAAEQARADVVRATSPYLHSETLDIIEGLMGALRVLSAGRGIIVDQTVEEVSEGAEEVSEGSESVTRSEGDSEAPAREIGECAGDREGNNRDCESHLRNRKELTADHCYARWLGRRWWCYFCRRQM